MMRSKERLRQCAAILGLLYILLLDPAIVMSAPLTVNDMHFDGGCYYNLELYKHGEQIRTNEPCLNCTCTNRMLMCYLNTCPYSKPIGSDCEVERMEGQCCPSIKCPEVPVIIPDVLPFVSVGKPPTTTAPPQPPQLVTTSALHHPLPVTNLEEGCFIEDVLHPEGSLVPSVNPCELCYCIRNHSACVMQNCTLQIAGCSPNYKDGHCCPVSYDCDKDVTIIPTTTTTELPLTGCYVDDIYHYDGSIINTGGLCEHCYCMKGKIICAVQECRAPEMDGCTAILGEDRCCPFKYDCPRTELPFLDDHTDKVVVDYLNVSSSELDAEDREKVPVLSSDNDITSLPIPTKEIPLAVSSTLKDVTDVTSELPEVVHQDSDLRTTETPIGVTVVVSGLSKNVSDEGTTSVPGEVEMTTEHIPAHHVDLDPTTEIVVTDSEIESSTSVSDDVRVTDVPATSLKDESISLDDSTQHSVEFDVSEKYDTETKGPVANDTIVAVPSAAIGTTTIVADVVEDIKETVPPMWQDEPSTTVAVTKGAADDASSAVPVSVADELTTSAEGVRQETSSVSSVVTEEETVSADLGHTTSKPIVVDDSSSSLPVSEKVPQLEEGTAGSPIYDNVSVTEESTDLPSGGASEDTVTTSADAVSVKGTSEDEDDEKIRTTQISIDKIDIVPVASSTSSYAEDVDSATEKATTEKIISNDDDDQSPSDSSVIEVLPSEVPDTSSAPADSVDVTTSERYDDTKDDLTTPKPDSSDPLSHVDVQDVAQNRTETTEGIVVPADSLVTTVPPSEETTEYTEVVKDVVVGSVPGEGDCYQDGLTHKNGDLVVSNDVCLVNCTCRSSIISCDKISCPIPDIVRNMTCRKLFEDGRCCPRFICEHTVVGDGVFSSDSLVTVLPPVTSSDVEVTPEATTEVALEESETTVHPQVPLNESVPSITDSSEEPRTVPPLDTTSIHVDDVPMEATTSAPGAEAEATAKPQPPTDVITTEKEEYASEAIPSDSKLSSSEPPAVIDVVQHVPDTIYGTTEKIDEVGVDQTTASVATDLEPALPSEAKNGTSEDILSNDVTTVSQPEDVSEEQQTTALPESYDESKIASSTSSSGQDVAGTVKDEQILTVTEKVKEKLASTASAEVVTDSVQTEEPLRRTESPVTTSELPHDEATVDATTPSLVDDDDQEGDLLTTSGSSKGPVLDLEETSTKGDIPEVTEAQRDPEAISSTAVVPLDYLTNEIKRNVTDSVVAMEKHPSVQQSPNVTDVPQKDEDVVPEVGYEAQTPAESEAVSTTPSQEHEITTSVQSFDHDIISNTIPAGSIDDATSKQPSLSLDEERPSTTVASDLVDVDSTSEPEPHTEDHSEAAEVSVPHFVPSTTEIVSVDSTVSIKDDDEVVISTKAPLVADEIGSTEKVVPSEEILTEDSTLKPSEEPPHEDASLKPDAESGTQQTNVELDVSVMETTEHVADATEKPLEDSVTTEEHDEESGATKEPTDDSVTTEEPDEDSVATKAPLDDDVTTKEPHEDSEATTEFLEVSVTTEEPQKDSAGTKEPQKDSVFTKEPLEDSVTTKEPLHDSVTTKEPLEDSVTTKEPLDDSVVTKELVEDSVTTEEPQQDSVATKEPLEASATTEEPREELVTTKKPLRVSVTTKEPLRVSVTSKPLPVSHITDSPSIAGDLITTKLQVAEERTDSPLEIDDALEITTVEPEKDVSVSTNSTVSASVTEKLRTSPPQSSTNPPTTIVTVKQPSVSEIEHGNVSSSTDKVVSQPLHTISSTTLPQSSITLATSSEHHPSPVHATAAPDLLPYPTEDYDDHLDQVNPDAGVLITSENFTIHEGDCVYESRIYSSAQQIPRHDPCDFCFCFRGDIICLQQSCPPPIEGCFEESIPGFCCPRYECPITAVTLNVTDPKTPPPYPVTASRFRTVRALTQVQVVVCEFRKKFYNRGEVIASASGPCMDCLCGDKGTMKCTPKTCQLDPLWHTLPNLRKFNKLESTRVGRNRF